jgi:hypothetical protein
MQPSASMPLITVQALYYRELASLAAVHGAPMALRCLGHYIDGESHYIILEVCDSTYYAAHACSASLSTLLTATAR